MLLPGASQKEECDQTPEKTICDDAGKPSALTAQNGIEMPKRGHGHGHGRAPCLRLTRAAPSLKATERCGSAQHL